LQTCVHFLASPVDRTRDLSMPSRTLYNHYSTAPLLHLPPYRSTTNRVIVISIAWDDWEVAIATDDSLTWCVSQSVCLSVTRLYCANTTERIEVQFGVEALGSPRNIVFYGGSDFPTNSMQPSPNYFDRWCFISCRTLYNHYSTAPLLHRPPYRSTTNRVIVISIAWDDWEVAIATDDCLTWCVSQSVCHAALLCKHDWTDRGPVWSGGSWEPSKHRILWGFRFPHGFDAAFAILLWPLVFYFLLVCAIVGTSNTSQWPVLRPTRISETAVRDGKNNLPRLAAFWSWRVCNVCLNVFHLIHVWKRKGDLHVSWCSSLSNVVQVTLTRALAVFCSWILGEINSVTDGTFLAVADVVLCISSQFLPRTKSFLMSVLAAPPKVTIRHMRGLSVCLSVRVSHRSISET